MKKIKIYAGNNILKMTLSLNCKKAGDPVYAHTMYGDTEEELLASKKHGIQVSWIYWRNVEWRSFKKSGPFSQINQDFLENKS